MELISLAHITAYFQCQSKAYLIIEDTKDYVKTDYEKMLEKSKEKIKQYYCKENKANLYYEGSLKKGIPLVYDFRGSLDCYDFNCEILFRQEGTSSLGNFYYIPGGFLGTSKISKENRMKMAFLGLVLEKFQGVYPDKSIIIDKNGYSHRIKISGFKNEVINAVKNINGFKKNQPKLTLNKHCTQCSFQPSCYKKAIKEDNLTLLNRISIKKVNGLERKGIFTVKQLSYTFKPRRKPKRVKESIIRHKCELQALAIRTKKIYVQQLPTIERKNVEIFLDIEGLPDDDFFYLFGILILNNEIKTYRAFWCDSREDEKDTWHKVIQILNSYIDTPIYHYGSYEPTAFDKLSRRYNTDAESIVNRFTNVNSFIFGKIYFPTFSNNLKELAEALGMRWSNENASGLQSIVWRNYWKEGKKEFKNILFAYNKDDCWALVILMNELTRIIESSSVDNNIEFIQNPKKRASEKGIKVHQQFDLVLKIAHNEYDRKKIKVDLITAEIKKINKKKKRPKGNTWLGKKIPKPNKTILIQADEFCPKHPNRKLNKSKSKSKRVKLDLVFTKNGVRKCITEYIGDHGFCPICNNSLAPIALREMNRTLYGHNYRAWVVFQRIEIQLPFEKICSTINKMVNDKLRKGTGVNFVESLSKYYEETEEKIVQCLLDGPFIHADETSVSISGELQYVWVFSSDQYVIFRLSKTRDSDTAKDFLQDYKGVLISDFYAGYDGINCQQQKCWVHLIRDLNNDLWKFPFDVEFEGLVCEIRNVIIPIINSTYIHGLKKRFLVKYQKNIDQLYEKHFEGKNYQSELCLKYQKRFRRYRDSLFTFVKNDGISWHNNLAENAIRHICVQRKISGSFGSNQFPHYLRMVSIMKTCKSQHKSFFNFLISKEKDLANFRK